MLGRLKSMAIGAALGAGAFSLLGLAPLGAVIGGALGYWGYEPSDIKDTTDEKGDEINDNGNGALE